MSLTAFNRKRRRDTPQEPTVFDMSGSWLAVRAKVRDELQASEMPHSKPQARQWLIEAGYKVVE